MTPQEFKAWRKGLYPTQEAAAEALGLGKSTIEQYERGVRKDTKAPVYIPLHIELACCELTRRAASTQAEQERQLATEFTISATAINEAVPSEGVHVLVWFDQGACIGARYGQVWREAQFGEDQLHGVTHWAEVPMRINS